MAERSANLSHLEIRFSIGTNLLTIAPFLFDLDPVGLVTEQGGHTRRSSKSATPFAEYPIGWQIVFSDCLQCRKHQLRHTRHESWRLVVVVVGKKTLPAATTSIDKSSYFVWDPSVWSFNFYLFNRHLLSCSTGSNMRV